MSEIAEYWAPELNRSPYQVKRMIAEAIWRGEFLRLRPLRFGWVIRLQWFAAPYPPGFRDANEEADIGAEAMAPVYDFYADHWPGNCEITETTEEDPIEDLVFTRHELREWAATRGLSLNFWGAPWGEGDGATIALPSASPPAGSTGNRERSVVKAGRRGPPPTLRLQIERQLQADLDAGKFTVEQLKGMKSAAFALQYGATRTYADEVRKKFFG